VTNLTRPKGNITGFTISSFRSEESGCSCLRYTRPVSTESLWLSIRANPTWAAYLRTIEAAAPLFGLRLIPAGLREVADIRQRLAALARDPNGAVVVLPSSVTAKHRESIIDAAAAQRLPAIYPDRWHQSAADVACAC